MPPFDVEKLIAAIMAVTLLSLIKETEESVEEVIKLYQQCLEAVRELP